MEATGQTQCNVVSSPNILQKNTNITPKSNSVMARFPIKTPGVIEIMTPGTTPDVGRGLFECGRFPDSSMKTKMNSSISMGKIDFTCEKDYIPICNQQLYSDLEDVPTNERPKTNNDNLYSPIVSEYQEQVEVSLAEMEGGNSFENVEIHVKNSIHHEQKSSIQAKENEFNVHSFDPNQYAQSPHLPTKNGLSSKKGIKDWYHTPVLK